MNYSESSCLTCVVTRVGQGFRPTYVHAGVNSSNGHYRELLVFLKRDVKNIVVKISRNIKDSGKVIYVPPKNNSDSQVDKTLRNTP